MYICMTCKKAVNVKDVNTVMTCKYCSGRVFIKERAKTIKTHIAR